jgi:hypothetical protein
MKADPRALIRAHYATLVDAQTGTVRIPDHLLFEGVPIIVIAVTLLIGVELPAAVSAGLVTVMGLMSAFFFGVMIQVLERALDWAKDEPEPGAATSRQARLLEEISANAGYASLVCILAAAIFVGAGVAHKTPLEIFSAVGLGLAAHVVLMLLMVIVRLFKLTQERLTDARTGATVTELPKRQAG